MKQVLPYTLLFTLFIAPVFPGLSQSSPSLMEQGVQALKQGQYRQAVSALEAHTRLHPQDLTALQALAEAYLNLEQNALAEATLQVAHRLDRNAARTHLLMGQLRLQQKDFLRARSELRTVLYLKQESPQLYYLLALTARELQQPAELEAALSQGLALSPEKNQLRARLLLLRAEISPDPEALLNELETYSLSPELRAAWQKQLFTHLVSSDQFPRLIDKAFESIEEAARMDNQQASTAAYAELLRWLGKSPNPDVDQAYLLRKMEKHYLAFPQDRVTRQQLIAQYERLNQPENLLALYRQELVSQAARLSPREQALLFRKIADVHLQMGYLQFAYDNYLRATDKDPSDVHSRLRLGVIYITARDFREAQKTFDKLLQEQPLLYEARLYLAFAQAFSKEPEKAAQTQAALPAEFEPELQIWLKSLIANQKSENMGELWRLLLPEFRNSQKAIQP